MASLDYREPEAPSITLDGACRPESCWEEIREQIHEPVVLSFQSTDVWGDG